MEKDADPDEFDIEVDHLQKTKRVRNENLFDEDIIQLILVKNESKTGEYSRKGKFDLLEYFIL